MCKKQQNAGRKVCPSSFTLMELLVVMSIMSMLMSILLPALSGAREQGKRVVCRSNIRNLTLAWYMYALDNEDKLCSGDTGWNTPGESNWVADGPDMPGNIIGGSKQAIEDGVLWTFTEETLGIYKCKSDASELLRSYCLSRTMNGKTCNCEHDNIKPFKSYTQISRPAEKMVFIDAYSLTNWIDGSFCPIVDIEAEPPEWFLRNSRNITARHNDGCNLSFADLHCGYFRYKDRRTVKLANWEIDPIEASDNNRDLKRMVQLLKGHYQD